MKDILIGLPFTIPEEAHSDNNQSNHQGKCKETLKCPMATITRTRTKTFGNIISGTNYLLLPHSCDQGPNGRLTKVLIEQIRSHSDGYHNGASIVRGKFPLVNLCASVNYNSGSSAFRTTHVNQAKGIDLQTVRRNSANVR